jgi:phage FluMu gp28-like protein
MREAYKDDPDGFAQECMCEFLDGSSVLLPYEIIALAESFEASEVIPPDFWTAPSTPSAQLYCGIDFGRSNDPSVCWTLERVGDVLVTREVLVLRNMDAPAQQEQLARRIARAARVSYDYTGPGIGLGDYLAKQFGLYKPAEHKFGKLELCVFTLPFKREIFPLLRRAFEAPTRLRIPVSVDIREDLHAVQQIVANGQYNYAAPRTAEGHSDRCTALALALRAAGSSGATASQSIPRSSRSRRSRAATL